MAARWLLDAGNTRWKLAFEDEAGLRTMGSWQRDTREGDPAVRDELRAALAGESAHAEVAAFACARRDDETLVSEVFAGIAARLHFLRHDAPLPFLVRYTSGAPGPDRLANVLALRERHPERPACSMDIGTATNLEVIDREGNFLGGAILPGPELQLRSLTEGTRGRLPDLDLHAGGEPVPIANSTEGAIRAGVILGHAGALERLASEIHLDAGEETRFVLTGGGAGLIARHLRFSFEMDPMLTLRGLSAYCRFMEGQPG